MMVGEYESSIGENLRKINKNHKKYLNDAMMTSIAGISAAMKNTG